MRANPWERLNTVRATPAAHSSVIPNPKQVEWHQKQDSTDNCEGAAAAILDPREKGFSWEQITHLCERISEQQNKQHMSWMCFQSFSMF